MYEYTVQCAYMHCTVVFFTGEIVYTDTPDVEIEDIHILVLFLKFVEQIFVNTT
jgi:hypothetical protein